MRTHRPFFSNSARKGTAVMVTLTDGAATALQSLHAEYPLDITPRLVRTNSGKLAVGTSAPAADDEVVYADQTGVLYLSAAATALAGCTLTAEATVAGLTLAVIRPAAPVATVAERLDLEQQWVASLRAIDTAYAQRAAGDGAPYARHTEEELWISARLVAATGAEPDPVSP